MGGGRKSVAALLWCFSLLSLASSGRAEPPGQPPGLRCLLRVSDGRWLGGSEELEPGAVLAVDTTPGSRQGAPARWAWAPDAVASCGLAPLSRRSLVLLLRNKWVGVLGDSVARLFSAALLRAVGDDSIAQPVLDGHRSFQYPLAAPGGRVDFVWAPFAENLTATLQGWREQGQAPDVLILGVSLWHMLHVHDVSAYAASLADVRAELDSIAGEERNARVAMFWMSTTALVTPKLLTAEKRARLTRDQIEAYNHAAADALSLPAGRPCQVLDVHRLTAACGDPCSEDGMHFHNATYDVLLQQWANALRFRRRDLVCSRPRSSRVAAADASLFARLCAHRGSQAP